MTAARLRAMPIGWTSLQASAMTRARETGGIIAEYFPDLELAIHRDIRECTPTTRREDIMADLEPGEAEECEANLNTAWDRIFVPAAGPDDEFDIVVCHGNVIRWFVTRVLEVDPAAWLGMSIANCSLTVVQVRADGSTKLIAFADSGAHPLRDDHLSRDEGRPVAVPNGHAKGPGPRRGLSASGRNGIRRRSPWPRVPRGVPGPQCTGWRSAGPRAVSTRWAGRSRRRTRRCRP